MNLKFSSTFWMASVLSASSPLESHSFLMFPIAHHRQMFHSTSELYFSRESVSSLPSLEQVGKNNNNA